jgi:outer membrane protein OmpA-like peptidoglycan-associated protein
LYAQNENHPLANTLRLTAKIAFNSVQVRPRPPAAVPYTQPMPIFMEPVAVAQPIVPEPEVVVEPEVVIMPEPVQATQTLQFAYNKPLIRFESMSSVISPDYVALLDSIATLMASVSDDAILRIVGHTDSVGIAQINNMLSESRARAIALDLIDRGVPAHSLTMQWMSDSQPIATNATRLGRAQNRRVHFEGDVVQLTGQNVRPAVPGANIPSALRNPVFRRNDLKFNFLELIDETSHFAKFNALATVLDENQSVQVYIGTRVNYYGSGRPFMSELEKSRSEKLRYLLILAGIDPTRVHVVHVGTPKWDKYIAPWVSDRLSEQTIVVTED